MAPSSLVMLSQIHLLLADFQHGSVLPSAIQLQPCCFLLCFVDAGVFQIGGTENLTELENLNEESFLAELRARYERDVIYVSFSEAILSRMHNQPLS